MLAHSLRFLFLIFFLSLLSLRFDTEYSIHTKHYIPHTVHVRIVWMLLLIWKRVFIVFPWLRWIAMKWKRTDWWIEMSAKNEIVFGKQAVSCSNVVDFVFSVLCCAVLFCFVSLYICWSWSFLYAQNQIHNFNKHVREWIVATALAFDVRSLENPIDLNYNESNSSSISSQLWPNDGNDSNESDWSSNVFAILAIVLINWWCDL